MKIPYGKDPNQFGELRLPEGPGPHPVCAFIHGGFWRARFDLTHADAHCEALTKSGIATWNIEYRRIGQPGGGWPGTAEDALAGFMHLAELFAPYGLDPTRVVLAGHSAGGHLALWVAAQNALPIQRVVSLCGVSDLKDAWDLQLSNGVAGEFIGGSPDDFPEEYSAASPIELLPIEAPQVLIHGTEDAVVPFAMSEAFASRSANARLIPLPGAGHSEVVDPSTPEWLTVWEQLSSKRARGADEGVGGSR
jgi:acetyl esterase/lipase